MLLGVVLLLASCSGDGDAEGAITTTTGQAPATAAATTTTQPSEADTKAAVLAAYRAFWDDVVATARTADWRSPRLDDHATGKMLDRIRSRFPRVREFRRVAGCEPEGGGRWWVSVDPSVRRLHTSAEAAKTASWPN